MTPQRHSGVWRPVRVLAIALSLAACGEKAALGPDTGGTKGQTLAGTLAAADGRTGVVTLSTPASGSFSAAPQPMVAGLQAGTVTLTGSVTLSDGTSAGLTGTWDTNTGALTVTGGGFALGGTITAGQVSGNFSGPGITGVFSLAVAEAAADLAVYCGTFTGRQPEDLPDGSTGTGPSNGTWNLVVGASTVSVVGVSGDDNPPFVIGGTRSGNTVSISVPGASATGTLSGAGDEFVDGTYNGQGGDQGTFQGSKAACTATTESAVIASLTINAPGLQPGNVRLPMDSTLTFVTARDAQGHFVAAPDLQWTFAAPLRANAQVTARGQKWVVMDDPTSYTTPPPPKTTTVTVTSKNNPAVSATATVVIVYY